MTFGGKVFGLVGLCVLHFYADLSPSCAQFENDSAAPIEIIADSMEWLNEEKIAIA